jgi:filamentous hemagglutinin family protein
VAQPHPHEIWGMGLFRRDGERRTRHAVLLSAIGLSFTIALSKTASAQRISIDGRLSPAQTLSGPSYAIGAGLGKQVGGNLFHSFGVFGLNQGETATFSGPASVNNVIGRVTGGTASSIDGKIQSTIQGASVYLRAPRAWGRCR